MLQGRGGVGEAGAQYRKYAVRKGGNGWRCRASDRRESGLRPGFGSGSVWPPSRTRPAPRDPRPARCPPQTPRNRWRPPPTKISGRDRTGTKIVTRGSGAAQSAEFPGGRLVPGIPRASPRRPLSLCALDSRATAPVMVQCTSRSTINLDRFRSVARRAQRFVKRFEPLRGTLRQQTTTSCAPHPLLHKMCAADARRPGPCARGATLRNTSRLPEGCAAGIPDALRRRQRGLRATGPEESEVGADAQRLALLRRCDMGCLRRIGKLCLNPSDGVDSLG